MGFGENGERSHCKGLPAEMPHVVCKTAQYPGQPYYKPLQPALAAQILKNDVTPFSTGC